MLVALVAALAAAPVDPAPADPGAITLRWDAPPSCPDAEVVRAHALRKAGPRGGAAVRAEATVRLDDDGTWGLVMMIGAERREIRASSCEALAEAAGLLIAVAADPSLAPSGPDTPQPPDAPNDPSIPWPGPGPLPGAEPPEEPPSTRRPGPLVSSEPPTPPPRRGATGAVRADVTGQLLRVLPAIASVAVGGAVALRLPAARVELRGRYFFGQRARYDDAPSIGGTIDLWTLGASGCYAPRWRRLELPVCAGLELGAMGARSFGATVGGSARAVFAALPIDATLIWAPVARVGLAVGLGATPTLRRPRFHVREREVLFAAGPIGLRLLAGVEIRFP